MMTPLGVCGEVHEMDIVNKQEIDDIMMITGPGSEKGCSVMSIFNQIESKTLTIFSCLLCNWVAI